jgi:hypothetical protein
MDPVGNTKPIPLGRIALRDAGIPAEALGRRGRLIRLLVTIVGCALLIYGTAAGNDDMFPFGPLSMYAGYYPSNGIITSNELTAQTAAGGYVLVKQADIGLTRAQIEGELSAFEDDPERLGELSRTYQRRHPQASPYVRMWILQERWELHNRAVVAHSTIPLVQWHAQ